jgi:transposase
MKHYSNDLRRRIVAAYETGDYSQDEIAELFGVCQKTVSNLVRRNAETGSPDRLPRGGGRQPQLDDKARLFISQQVKQTTHISLAHLCQRVDEKFNKQVSQSTMCRALEALGLPRKKRRSTQVNATAKESNRRALLTKSRQPN